MQIDLISVKRDLREKCNRCRLTLSANVPGSFIAMVKPLGAAGMVIQLCSWVTYWLFAAVVSSRVATLQDELDAPSPPSAPSQQEPNILMILHRDEPIPTPIPTLIVR